MKRTRIVAMLVVLSILTGSLLTACSQQPAAAPKPAAPATGTPAPAPATTDTYDEVVKRGSIRVGLINSPPSAVKDPNSGQWSGFASEVLALLAKPLGVKVEVVECDWQNIIANLQAGKIDVAWAGMYATPERAMSVWFTRPYHYAGTTFVIRKEDAKRFKSLEDLNKPEIILTTAMGTATVDIMKERFPKAQLKEVQGATRFQEVGAKRSDAGSADWDTCNAYVQEHKDWAMIWPEVPFAPVPVSACVRRGDEQWLRYIDTCLAYFESRGTLGMIVRKYYKQPKITE